MTTRSNFARALRVLATIAFLTLPGQQTSAHKAHEKAATTRPEAEVSQPADEDMPVRGLAAGSMMSHAEEPAAPEAEAAPDAKYISPLEWGGRLHPMLVHFPIALLISALIAEMLFARTGSAHYRHALRFTLWGGVLASIPTVALGWIFAATGPTEQGWLLETHRWTGSGAAVMGMIALAVHQGWVGAAQSRFLLRVCLVLVATLIGATGFLGGSLVYGIDHLLWFTR